ncbi:hypothetical protein FMM05_06965 [Flavobacterium zepuense]|uniref:Uncharacterized protein n=1 Tax=Flavobacterium zepuense TaxID=2593302 RepID=A0A552V648_9FLAO|nr:hypothetical protein [Flavobacterium zepuense]TRW25956.1 hypothetical protein FMM05_06965 [Flavobacterium zepuense]
MKDTYFKTRRPFKKRQHRYEIGSPVGLWNLYDDNHFLARLYKIGINEQEAYYHYHMHYATSTGKCNEAEFYSHVREIVADHIEALRKESPFSTNHAIHRANLKCLRTFRDYLVSINIFGYRDPVDITITRYDSEISSLKRELAQKEKLIQKMKAFETDQKIRITKGYLYTLVDLIQQLPELKLPEDSGMRLLRPSTEMVWVKMICKYFQHGDEEISSQTLRSYFPANKDVPGIKYRIIQEKYKLYRIVSSNKSK